MVVSSAIVGRNCGEPCITHSSLAPGLLVQLLVRHPGHSIGPQLRVGRVQGVVVGLGLLSVGRGRNTLIKCCLTGRVSPAWRSLVGHVVERVAAVIVQDVVVGVGVWHVGQVGRAGAGRSASLGANRSNTSAKLALAVDQVRLGHQLIGGGETTGSCGEPGWHTSESVVGGEEVSVDVVTRHQDALVQRTCVHSVGVVGVPGGV